MFLTSLLGLFSIQKGILIDVTWSLIGQFTIASTSFYLRFREQYILRQQIKKQFEHYLDPRQVKKLQENPELLKLGGEKRYCTYMFTDVRGFTSMSEKLEPEKVTMIMNKALSVQANAVKSNQGMVDKYIGDAMMACWNAPLDIKNHQNLALKTAKQIIINMETLNKELIEEKLPQIKIGIGINTGWAVVGNMGSDDRFEFTSLGDTVNLCARLESSTKEKGVDVLIGEETKRTCSFDLKKLDAIMVKGKSKKVNIYTFS
jgi:adenylate cyclase